MVGGMRGQVNKSECVGGLSTGEKVFHFASENQLKFGPVQNLPCGRQTASGSPTLLSAMVIPICTASL